MFGIGKKKEDPKKLDYEKLGKAAEGVLIKEYLELLQSTKRQIGMAFVKGIFTGFGGVVGATLVVGLVLWTLTAVSSATGDIPFVSDILRNLGTSLNDVTN